MFTTDSFFTYISVARVNTFIDRVYLLSSHMTSLFCDEEAISKDCLSVPKFHIKHQVYLYYTLFSCDDNLKVKSKFLHSAVLGLQEFSKSFTLYSMTDLFNRTHLHFFGKYPATLQLIREGSSYKKYPPLPVQVLFHTAE